MIKKVQLPEEFVTGIGEKRYPIEEILKPKVEKRTIEGVDEIQHLYVSPWTAIKKHGHDDQWEVWIRISHKTAHVCLKGEMHELINNSGAMMIIMAIKGHSDYSFEELEELLKSWGFNVSHGSLVAKD